MHSTSNSIKFTSYSEANEVADELSVALRLRFQVDLETSVRRSDFIFDSVQLMYYKCHKGNFFYAVVHILIPHIG